MARQAHAEKAWASVERFYHNCAIKTTGKKGYPKFKKEETRASLEYKTCGYKLSEDRKFITFTDGFKAGTFKLWGSRDLHYYQLDQIKRVRVVRRADGYYVQFCIDHTREEKKELTGKNIGLDVGLTHFYTDSDGNKIENPRFLRKDEKKLKRLSRQLSKKKKGSKNRTKARNKLGRAHLKVTLRADLRSTRRRNDWVCKEAQRVIQSNDLVAVENLQVRNMVKNHNLAKSINDAAWYKFRVWLEYFGSIYGVPVIAVNPQYTSQNCSSCGQVVKKSLSQRTHTCSCGCTLDRDHNAGKNILQSALKHLSTTLGHKESNVSGETDLCLTRETELDKPTRRKRKASA